MAQPLPPLRRGLDLMPSPVEDRPGLLMRDPLGYSDAVVIVPPPLVPLLGHFDGRHSELDLRQALVRATGDLRVGAILRQLVETLSRNGFLEDEAFARLRTEREAAFARAPLREPAHAGSAYPAEADALRAALAGWLDAAGAPDVAPRPLRGIAAPHVSPGGGPAAYAAAYRLLEPSIADRTVVVLGTSHYGAPDRLGLTRKPYVTPLGATRPALDLVERLAEAGGPGVLLEDYCHAVEHSIEFQVVFLQHLLGPDLRVLPILCGPLLAGGLNGLPEQDAGVRRALAALAGLAASEGDRLFWVLGVDLAHIGRRYGDDLDARAGDAQLASVERLDRERLARVAAGDADGLWRLLREGGDPLRWCGASPLYGFLRAVAPVRGELLRYEQWNIDPASVVSFAGIAFS